LALSDVYLFGKLKMALMGAVFADDEVWRCALELLHGISREGHEAVFEQ
jgi:hypothetical protein